MIKFTYCWICLIIFCFFLGSSWQRYIDVQPPAPEEDYDINPIDFSSITQDSETYMPTQSISNPKLRIKRSRFYQRYPDQRRNRSVNDVYECNPNSKETMRLLNAIHQTRRGEINPVIFCNRVRNPKNIIPNPRYVGK